MKAAQIPWPDASLSPNSRAHWAKRARCAKALRRAAFFAACEAGLRVHGRGRINVSIYAHPPIKRRRDADNLLAQCKAALDGIADWLKVNDAKFNPVVHIGETRNPGCLFITVEDDDG